MPQSTIFCDNDEENEAVCFCEDCDQNLCADCNDVFHRSKPRQLHKRIPINNPGRDRPADFDELSDDEVIEDDSEAEQTEETEFKAEGRFNLSLDQCMQLQRTTHPTETVPLILSVLVKTIVQKGGLTEEGIFRISPDKNELDRKKADFNCGNYDIDFESPHIATGLLKLWLRELPSPLIPTELYAPAIACGEMQDKARQATKVLGIWSELDPLRQRVVSYIASLAQQIMQPARVKLNKMSYGSLATLFTPSLLRNPNVSEALVKVRHEIEFVKVLLEVVATTHLHYLYEGASNSSNTVVLTLPPVSSTATTSSSSSSSSSLRHSESVVAMHVASAASSSSSYDQARLPLRTVNTNSRESTVKSSKPRIQSLDSKPGPSLQGRQILKVLIVGNASCGKTSLIRRYVTDSFESEYITTVGADYNTKSIQWADGVDVMLQLWDIAGQDRYARMTRAYFQGAHAAVVVCDVTREASINAVKDWKNDIDVNLSNIPVVLVANKCDLLADGMAGMQVGGRLQELCSEMNFVSWHIISAKRDMNVTEAMSNLVKAALESRLDEQRKQQRWRVGKERQLQAQEQENMLPKKKKSLEEPDFNYSTQKDGLSSASQLKIDGKMPAVKKADTCVVS